MGAGACASRGVSRVPASVRRDEARASWCGGLGKLWLVTPGALVKTGRGEGRPRPRRVRWHRVAVVCKVVSWPSTWQGGTVRSVSRAGLDKVTASMEFGERRDEAGKAAGGERACKAEVAYGMSAVTVRCLVLNESGISVVWLCGSCGKPCAGGGREANVLVRQQGQGMASQGLHAAVQCVASACESATAWWSAAAVRGSGRAA